MKRKYVVLGLVVGVAAVLAIALGIYYGTRADEQPQPTPAPPIPGSSEHARIDCYPEGQWGHETVTRQSCESRGCRFQPFGNPDVYVPPCFVSEDSVLGKGLKVTSGPTDTTLGVRYELEPKVTASEAVSHDVINNVISHVMFDIEFRSTDVLRFKFYDRDSSRFQVPEEVLRIDLPDVDIRKFGQEPRYDVQVTSSDPFAFRVVRVATGTILWDTRVGGLVLADQFLSISTALPSHNIYGFGENSHDTFRHDMSFRTWGMFARDQWVGTGTHNHYSVHPFYTNLENDGNSHGVLFLNSNAQDYTLSPLPMLTYRTIGGILDVYMFLGPTPEGVVQQYTGAIGRPYMPPYWALGFQLCRYGYNNLDNLKAAVNRTVSNNIPLDVQYADIDHYDERKIFTIDHVAFAGLAEYFDGLRAQGHRTIIILDPCIIANETLYEPYDKGLSRDIFIKWPSRDVMPAEDFRLANNTLNMLGFVWPKGRVAMPDFLLNRTQEVWGELIRDHYTNIRFDGLWIDMNEPANFGTNELRPWNWPEKDHPYWSLKCPEGDPKEHPPYRTMAAYVYDGEVKANLSDKTLCMTATQADGKYQHYDVHSLYGASQIQSTLSALRDVTNERGLVLGRSTFPGSGHTSGHWLGDNFSTWKQMKDSIIGMLEFNLFGFPYIGADICGFFEETNAELCKRWMQLGAFYPYSRNHNQADNKIDQDPANFNEEVTRLSRDALNIRYTLLPYLYTLFHHANTRGSTVVRPLFHEFAQDNVTWGLDEQFLWGPALHIAPILHTNLQMEYYLPQARWYDYHTWREVQYQTEAGRWHTEQVLSDSAVPLFVRGGFILPTQDVDDGANRVRHTADSRQKPFHLRIYLDDVDKYGGKASGDLFWDDGVTIDALDHGQFYFARMSCQSRVLTVDVAHDGVDEMRSLTLDRVTVVPVDQRPSAVLVNGALHYNFYHENQMLVVQDILSPMSRSLTLEWSEHSPAPPEEAARLDCQPDGADQEACTARGCLWADTAPSPGAPRCFIDRDRYGYSFVQETTQPSDRSREIQLKWMNASSMFGGDLPNIQLHLEVWDRMLRVKFHSGDRYEVPVPLHTDPLTGDTTPVYTVDLETDPAKPFSLKVTRNSNSKVIWDTSIGGLTFADQFLQLATRVPSRNLFGFGENKHPSFRHDFRYQTWPMFSRDQAPGWGDYGNLYGVHPYYLCLEEASGAAHGVLLHNSNAMEVALTPDPAVTYRTTGGVLDFYIVFGDNPEDVTQSYLKLIGRPYLPAYWSLGFQLCRYGYETLDNMKAAVDRTIEAGIPYDVQNGDIDHFYEQRDFTWDSERFAGLPEYFRHLRDDKHLRTIIILDPAIIAVDQSYEPFTSAGDIFIRWPDESSHPDIAKFNSRNMHGYVWPVGETVFPDFFRQEAHEWWQNWIQRHHGDIVFDGLWIDMNEPANFGTNEEQPWNWPPERDSWSLKCPESSLDDPPYKPRSVFGARLSEKTVCMVGRQTDGAVVYNHYDVHSLYGWSQSPPTLKGLLNTTGERGVVITRSTYPGSGSMAGHWLGDNDSSWAHLRDSIIGILEFNLFGIPYIGADICGYFGDTEPELCQRWMQLGAFYTFSRNHNGRYVMDQDPAALGMAVATSSKKVLQVRYTLLPYLYTLFYHSHVEGSTVIRSLLHEFYADPRTYDNHRQFLWGPALLISPVLEQGAVSVDAYLPDARWFDYYTGAEAKGYRGKFASLDAPLDHIPLHVRGGHIMATQRHANNTFYSRKNSFGVIVAPSDGDEAAGDLFWDDGVEIDSAAKESFRYFTFTYSKQELVMATSSTFDLEMPSLENIRVFGVQQAPTSITVTVGGSSETLGAGQYAHHPTTQELYIRDLELALNAPGLTGWTVRWG